MPGKRVQSNLELAGTGVPEQASRARKLSSVRHLDPLTITKGDNMKKAFLLLGFALLLTAVVVAAGVDFSGTWAVNAEKTAAANPAPPGGGGGGGRGGMGGGEMTIKQTGNELSVTTVRGQNTIETKYTMDGAEHSAEAQGGTMKYKAVLGSDNVTITGTRTTQRGEQPINTTYTLSADGKTLTVTNVMNMGGQQMERKQIYDKK
jgi:pectate lyase